MTQSTITGSYLKNLNSSNQGGGIYSSGPVTVMESQIEGSTLINRSGVNQGGAIYALGLLTVTDSTLTSSSLTTRSSVNEGGGIYATGDLTVTNSTVSNNSLTGKRESTNRGGGIWSAGGTGTLTGSTVTGNTVKGTRLSTNQGGGLYEGALTLTHSLIAGNYTSGGRQAVNRGAEIFGGSISSGDSPNLLGHAGVSSSTAFEDFTPSSTDIDATSGRENLPLTTILNPTLANNGGPTLTHNLVSGSVAIDAAGTCGLTEDQRGAPRAADDCDIGAVEWTVGPVASVGSVPSPVSTDTMATLDGSESFDQDGGALTYAWEITEQPSASNADLSSTTTPAPTITPDVGGDYTIELVVTDQNDQDSQPGSETFSAIDGPTDPGNSMVEANPTTVHPDGSTEATMTVTLIDSQNAPVVGHTVALTQTGSSIILPAATHGPSNVNGQVLFTVTNNTEELVTYTATDITDPNPANHVQVTDTADVDFNVSYLLEVTLAGDGTGVVSSQPSGIICPSMCEAVYVAGTVVTLVATAVSTSMVRSTSLPPAVSIPYSVPSPSTAHALTLRPPDSCSTRGCSPGRTAHTVPR